VTIELLTHLYGCDSVAPINNETPLLERRHHFSVFRAERPPHDVGESGEFSDGHHVIVGPCNGRV